MQTYKIKHRHTGAVLYSGGGESLRDVVVAAVRDGTDLSGADLSCADLRRADLSGADLSCADLRRADLSCADLRRADLSGADLRGAYLSCADLRGAYLSAKKLIGERPILQVGPMGSRCDYLASYLTDAGVFVRAGCFFGSLDEFRNAVDETHGDNTHGREYRAAIEMIRAHADVWTPAEAEKEEA